MKWVKPENLHLTLKFLGETEESMIKKLDNSLQNISLKIQKFMIQLKQLGVFPNLYRPRIIWVGISTGQNGLADLAQSIENETSQLGFDKENREFKPHMTIGRVRTPRYIDKLVIKLDKYKEHFFGEQEVEKISLMQSILKPTGPEYVEKVNWLLK